MKGKGKSLLETNAKGIVLEYEIIQYDREDRPTDFVLKRVELSWDELMALKSFASVQVPTDTK